MTQPLIGVSPPPALESRARLFAALSDALDVRFASAGTAPSGVAALVQFGDERTPTGLPTLVLGAGRGVPTGATHVQLTRSVALDTHLRSWTIPDDAIAAAPSLEASQQSETLATAGDRPVWCTQIRDGIKLEHAALVPTELGNDETLTSRLVPRRFFDLLPLVHFLRTLDRPDRWHLPPVCASFVMDDPNLHSVRYGYLDFEQLALDATHIGFHMSVSTIPLDGWLVQRKAAHLFRTRQDVLSLLIHGNNHTRHELCDGRAEQSRLQMIAQALRRVRVFEARTGLPVAKVMTAPHGRCSEAIAWDLARLGLESLCISRTFPWLERPPADQPLAGWFPADTSTPTPVLRRMPLSSSPEQLPLRAFLAQPIILYGHHSDLADGTGVLAEWAERVARLDGVTWASVGEISRRLVSWRSCGDTIVVRPHTRLVEFQIPVGASRIRVERPGGIGYEHAVLREESSRETQLSPSDPQDRVATLSGQALQRIQINPSAAIEPYDVQDPSWSAWPLTRRFLTEARDRARPRVDAMRGRAR
jgi:hypothetical protein